MPWGPTSISTGQCVSIPITMSVPSCVTNTVGAKWTACAILPANNKSKCANGTMICHYVKPDDDNPTKMTVPKGDPVTLSLKLVNTSGDAVSAPCQIAVFNAADEAPDEAIFSLDGLEPGTPVEGAVSMAPGGDTTIPVTIEALSVDLLGWYNLMVALDLDGDGAFEPIGAVGLQAVLEAPPPPCPADSNGDGQVNVQDMVIVLLAWGTSGPDGDVNGDGMVDVVDLVAVILAWGACQ